MSTIAVFDARPFFDKAVAYGVQHGLLSADKLQQMQTEGAKGVVQIARYFGTEYLRPELEQACLRMVQFISLHLQHATQGELRHAAELLRDNSLLSRSKAGVDLLKTMLGLPQSTHFGLQEAAGFRDEHIPLLAKWSLKPGNELYPEFQAEYQRRQQIAAQVEAAHWFASQLDMDADELQECERDADAIIRTGLLALACKCKKMPAWAMWDKIVNAFRTKYSSEPSRMVVPLPADLPPALQATVEQVRESIYADAPRLLNAKVSVSKLFSGSLQLASRYYWRGDLQADVQEAEKTLAKTWAKATGGHTDEASLLTLFVNMAAGYKAAAGKTMLTEKAAATLVRKLRKTGLDDAVVTEFIRTCAPDEHRDDYLALWQSFLDESRRTLLSDMDYQLYDALAVLRRECNVLAD